MDKYDRDQSEFDMAVSYLGRLNALFYQADQAAMNLDIYNWFHALLCLFRELSTEMKEDEIEKWKEKTKKINQKMSKHIQDPAKFVNGQVSNDLYEDLNDFELYLRGILKKAGLQNKIRTDPGSALS